MKSVAFRSSRQGTHRRVKPKKRNSATWHVGNRQIGVNWVASFVTVSSLTDGFDWWIHQFMNWKAFDTIYIVIVGEKRARKDTKRTGTKIILCVIPSTAACTWLQWKVVVSMPVGFAPVFSICWNSANRNRRRVSVGMLAYSMRVCEDDAHSADSSIGLIHYELVS